MRPPPSAAIPVAISCYANEISMYKLLVLLFATHKGGRTRLLYADSICSFHSSTVQIVDLVCFFL